MCGSLMMAPRIWGGPWACKVEGFFFEKKKQKTFEYFLLQERKEVLSFKKE
jgi:hypothetical protein